MTRAKTESATKFGQVMMDVAIEIERAHEKHGAGPMASSFEMFAILAEELGEVAQAILKNQPDQVRLELIQVMAVAADYLIETGPRYTTK